MLRNRVMQGGRLRGNRSERLTMHGDDEEVEEEEKKRKMVQKSLTPNLDGRGLNVFACWRS
jgi:hypothetical protein